MNSSVRRLSFGSSDGDDYASCDLFMSKGTDEVPVASSPAQRDVTFSQRYNI